MAASFDSVHNAAGVSSAADADGDFTYAVTVPGTANLVILPVCMGVSPDSGMSIASIAVNGAAATKLGSSVHSNASTSGFIDLWYLQNPTSGNVVITSNANGADILTNAVYYAGAGTPTGFVSATGSTSPITVNINAASTSVAGNFMAQGHMDFASAGTYNRTKRWALDLNNNTAAGACGYQDMTGTGASAAMSMTPIAIDWWASIAFEIPAGGGPPPPPPFVIAKEGGGFILTEAGVPLG